MFVQPGCYMAEGGEVDDRTYYIAVAVLAIAIGVIAIDAILSSFVSPPGLWTTLAAVAAFLGARGILRNDGDK